MKPGTFSRFVTAAVFWATATHAATLDKDFYLENVAPSFLERLDAYKADRGNNLTLAQDATLDLAKKVVLNFAPSELGDLTSICDTTFGKDECAKILGDGQLKGKRSLDSIDNIETRNPDCECAWNNDYCYMHHPNDWKCVYHADACKYSSCKS